MLSLSWVSEFREEGCCYLKVNRVIDLKSYKNFISEKNPMEIICNTEKSRWIVWHVLQW